MEETSVIENTTVFGRSSLELDVPREVERIVGFLRETVLHKLHRQGAIVGISGGIDSSVVLALCVRALGPERVEGILLPEKESSPDSCQLAHLVADCYSVHTVTEDMTSALEGLGCYQRRDEAIRRVIPEYQPGWSTRIALPGDLLDHATLNVFYLIVTSPDGHEYRKRMPPKEFRQVVAATNFKQRARMSMLYYHAELRNYAMIGTPQKNEHDLGFFVKNGDGGYDIGPIAHLFKSQVYQLAPYLGVPEVIQKRTPSTDTYPGGGSQEEFFFRIPFDLLDAIWLGFERGYSNTAIANGLGLTPEQVKNVVMDITSKRNTTAYLRTGPITLEAAETNRD
jgi:NAD+ synthase